MNHCVPAWVRTAIVKTLGGLVLAFITAGLIVWLSQVFPGLQEYGEDFGLRAGVWLDRTRGAISGTAERVGEADPHSYVFLDMDPEHGLATAPGSLPTTPSEQACDAYVRAAKDGRVATQGALPPLNCSPARPLNRYLIAALVAELIARKARMIILDVVLAEERGVVDEAENASLRRVMSMSERPADGPAVLFVGAYEPVLGSGQPHQPAVKKVMASLLPDDAQRGVCAAAALPSPGQPVRRYPKCVLQVGVSGAGIPNLPYVAAQSLSKAHALCTPCTGAEAVGNSHGQNAPRIIYTLPSISAHQDDGSALARAQWAHYRKVYERCLAASFWDAEGSHCGEAQTYTDKVVVVGASNALRRDRHYTPLGDMAGAEIVINAIRSFVAYPTYRDKTLSELLVKKSGVVAFCGLVWFGYFLVRCRMFPPHSHAAAPSPVCLAARGLLVCVAFLAALVIVVATAIYWSFSIAGPVPSMDVLVPVLAIALDEYVEQASRIVHAVESLVGRVLGLADGHAAAPTVKQEGPR